VSERLTVRSYRRVFEVDRRIYRVDRWVLPVPGGVPLRGVAYFVGALLAVLAAERLPVIGAAVGGVSAPFRYVVIPLGAALLGTQAAPDGRASHRFAIDWLRLRLRSRRRCAGRAVALEREPVRWDGVLPTRWDADAPALHGAEVAGPARVTFAVGVSVSQHRRGRVVVRPRAEGPADDAVVVAARQVLEVRR
jgi:TcpE family